MPHSLLLSNDTKTFNLGIFDEDTPIMRYYNKFMEFCEEAGVRGMSYATFRTLVTEPDKVRAGWNCSIVDLLASVENERQRRIQQREEKRQQRKNQKKFNRMLDKHVSRHPAQKERVKYQRSTPKPSIVASVTDNLMARACEEMRVERERKQVQENHDALLAQAQRRNNLHVVGA